MANEILFHGLNERIAKLREREIRARNTPDAGAREIGRSSYHFELHQHPLVSELVGRLVRSVDVLEAADTEIAPTNVLTPYRPQALADSDDPANKIAFDEKGPYAVYNWELFFHIPLTLAIHLSKNERFEEARRWFHVVFDPTDRSAEASPQRFWKVPPFKIAKSAMKSLEQELRALADGNNPELAQAIRDWKDHPFRPHVIARRRPVAYMLRTVMAYLDNLIAWGDSLFRQDTREAINDALQLYILAANLLGERPQRAPTKGTITPRTYADLRAKRDALGNIFVDLEADIPFDAGPLPADGNADPKLGSTRSLGQTLYFCVPHNDRLLGYWDTVADRLFKIRNSLNFDGVFRQLPLFPPPIDPGLLVAAAAAGLDVAAIAGGANQPLPIVRYAVLAQRANELCQEVRALASQLLASLEKLDGEKLAILRAAHERRLLELGELVKYSQLQEALKQREALEKSKSTTTTKFEYYERLLNADVAEIKRKVPPLVPIDVPSLADLAYNAIEPVLAPRTLPIEPAVGSHLSTYERKELTHLEAAQRLQDQAAVSDVIGALMNIIPTFSLQVKPLGLGATVSFGGSNIAAMFSAISTGVRAVAAKSNHDAVLASKAAVYERRQQEWAFQSALASHELEMIDKQIRAAEIRVAIADREWRNHQKQTEQSREIETFLSDEQKGKTTGTAFYARLKAELRGLHTRAFDLAFEVARKAERALQYELGAPELRFLSPSYLAGNEGLLAAEKLAADLKRMEIAHLDRNVRELELTKHVSLLSLDPVALLQLRATGTCTIALPETLFDLDAPGHYFRRLKSVAVTIPCVSGPYTNVHCKLALTKSSIRTKATLPYDRQPNDDRFQDDLGSTDAIVTSTAVNDAGLFEVNLRDERYLPFEGRGAISEWTLELLGELPTFDRDSISDVILQVRYTARDGTAALAAPASEAVRTAVETATAVGSVRLFSIRHEFPNEWARFKAALPGPSGLVPLMFGLALDHYPFWHRALNRPIKVHGVSLYARTGRPTIEVAALPASAADHLVGAMGLVGGTLANAATAVASPAGEVTLYLDTTDVEDVFVAISWGV